jgi:hypothetical protein
MPSVNRAAAMLVLCLAAGCVPQYHPPSYDQPHAILKFRRTYVYSAGESLAERLLVEDQQAYAHTSPSGTARAPHTDVVLVHPAAARVVATSKFVHDETQSEQETFWAEVPYTTTETYDCGTFDSPQTCVRTVTENRSELQSRTVYRTVEVTDAACASELTIRPADRDIYLLELDFQAPGVCRLSCFQQLAQPGGTFTMRPCPVSSRRP